MPEWTREQKRERVRNRVNKAYSPENHQYFPAKEDSSTVGWDDYLRVGIYVRVSTSDPNGGEAPALDAGENLCG